MKDRRMDCDPSGMTKMRDGNGEGEPLNANGGVALA